MIPDLVNKTIVEGTNPVYWELRTLQRTEINRSDSEDG